MNDKIIVEFSRKELLNWCKENCSIYSRCKNKNDDGALVRCFIEFEDIADILKIRKEQNNVR